MKRLILDKCNDCKHVHKGYYWNYDHRDYSLWLVIVWTCSKMMKTIKNGRVPAQKVITTNFNRQEFEREVISEIQIPGWCPLKDDK